MDITIKKTGSLYQIDDNDTPIDINSLKEMLKSIGQIDDKEIQGVIDEVDENGEKKINGPSNKGVIVDLYEVEYPTPSDPEKSTQELASHLDEKHDFVTQYLFPDSTTDEVIVGLRQDLMDNHLKEDSQMSSKSSLKSFKVAYALPLKEDQINYIKETGTLPDNFLLKKMGMTKENWLNFTPPVESALDSIYVGEDTDSYFIIAEGKDLSGKFHEYYRASYEELLNNKVNLNDLIAVLAYVVKKGPELTKTSSLATFEDDIVLPIFVARRKTHG